MTPIGNLLKRFETMVAEPAELEGRRRAYDARALFRLLNVCPPSGSPLNPLPTQAD